VQATGANSLRQLLFKTQPADIARIGVEGGGEARENPQAAEDAQQVLRADAAVASLESGNRVAADAGPIRELSLGQAAQAAPDRDIVGEFAQGAADSGRNSSPFFVFSRHISVKA
jgi:hypothetical protein